MTRAEILESLRSGESVADIAAESGRTMRTIYRFAHDAGIVLRKYVKNPNPAPLSPEMRDDYAGAKAVLTYAAPCGPMRVIVFCKDTDDAAAQRERAAEYWRGDLSDFHVEQRRKTNKLTTKWVKA
jgi:hypothetical protein